MMLAILPLAAVIAILPVADWLHLRHVGNGEARLVLELFLLQLFSMMVFALLSNSFMAVNRAHRGINWTNALAGGVNPGAGGAGLDAVLLRGDGWFAVGRDDTCASRWSFSTCGGRRRR